MIQQQNKKIIIIPIMDYIYYFTNFNKKNNIYSRRVYKYHTIYLKNVCKYKPIWKKQINILIINPQQIMYWHTNLLVGNFKKKKLDK